MILYGDGLKMDVSAASDASVAPYVAADESPKAKSY